VFNQNLVARECAKEASEELGLRPARQREVLDGARPVRKVFGQSQLARGTRDVDRLEALEHRLEHYDLRRREPAPQAEEQIA
jgi:hypothetical protein